MEKTDLEFEWFKKKVLALTGVDLGSYRSVQMKRLMSKAIEKAGARNYVEFIKFLGNDPAKIQEFKDSLTINVSSLFRDARKWETLAKLLPDLVRSKAEMMKDRGSADSRKTELLAWSAGCSIGAEPCTIAIILEELAASGTVPPFTYRIMCTDIDSSMLARAKECVFGDRDLREMPGGLMEKYFSKIPRPAEHWARSPSYSEFFQIDRKLRMKMSFLLHNLLDEKWEKGFNLITCRNVMIYFNNETKDQLFRKFAGALAPGGLLFIGGTEIIFRPTEFGLSGLSAGIYRKNDNL